MKQIEQLLDDIAFKIGTLREARKHFSAQLAPDFRIFDFLRTDEMGLSRCLASLLDPKGRHGQGSIFLEEFLNILGSHAGWVIDLEKCEITTEKQANGQRRIDIYLTFPNGCIGIENKPWANDQENQLSDYATYLERSSSNKPWLLVFLSNRSPSKESICSTRREILTEQGQFIHRDYDAIILWLKHCSFKSQSPVVRVFVEELSKFIRVYVNGDPEMLDEIEINSAILKTTNTLGSAFQIMKAMKGIKNTLLNELQNDLILGLEKEGLMLADWSVGHEKKYTGFSVQFGTVEQNLNLRFEFDGRDFDNFFWGIAKKHENYINPAVWGEVNTLMASSFYQGKTTSWWPWYSECTNPDFDGDMRNWSSSEKPWLMIKEKVLASKIIALSARVKSTFGNDFDLLK